MTGLRILHLEDDTSTVTSIQRVLGRSLPDAHIECVSSRADYLHALANTTPALVLCADDVQGFTAVDAVHEVRRLHPCVPVVVVSAVDDEGIALACIDAGADDFVLDTSLERLPVVMRRLRVAQPHEDLVPIDDERRALSLLVAAVKELSLARTLEEIAVIVRKAARALNGADGATFVLSDGDQCHYFDEDAIAPLWKGQRFPLSSCISGWVMEHCTHAAITDIYDDPRIPAGAYRPTFVKSLVMVPVRREAPVAAIGNYWATSHTPTEREIEHIQALADSTSIAMENVRIYQELEQRVRDRTVELEGANKDLEAFSYSVSHDLRTPVSQVLGFADLLRDDLVTAHVDARPLDHITTAAHRMNALIDDLLRLSQVSQAHLARTHIDVTALARAVADELVRTSPPGRSVTWNIHDGLVAWGDAQLVRVLLENLLGNAHKYSGRREHAVIEVGAQPSDAHATTIFVHDNGAGFDGARVSELFTPFKRLHAASDFPGTGIGLATCQRIVHRHGGRIWADASVDVGATFSFSLPARA